MQNVRFGLFWLAKLYWIFFAENRIYVHTQINTLNGMERERDSTPKQIKNQTNKQSFSVFICH